MQQFSLYDEEESISVKKNQTSPIIDETVVVPATNLVNETVVQEENSSDMKEESALSSEESVIIKTEEEEAKVNKTLASEDIASSGSSDITNTETDTAEPTDSLPVISMLPKNPPSISSTSDNKETDS